MVPDARRFAFRVVIGQAAITGLAASLALGIAGARAGLSAALGGGIGTAASLAMALLAFPSRAHTDAQTLARAFYVGEATKLGVTVVLFVLVLKFLKVATAALFAGFIATFLIYWVALALASAGWPADGKRGI